MELIKKWWFWLTIALIIILIYFFLYYLGFPILGYYCGNAMGPNGIVRVCDWGWGRPIY